MGAWPRWPQSVVAEFTAPYRRTTALWPLLRPLAPECQGVGSKGVSARPLLSHETLTTMLCYKPYISDLPIQVSPMSGPNTPELEHFQKRCRDICIMKKDQTKLSSSFNGISIHPEHLLGPLRSFRFVEEGIREAPERLCPLEFCFGMRRRRLLKD